MTTLKAVSSRIRFLLLLPLFTAGAVHGAPKSFVQQAQNPFDNNGDSLPDLGMAQPTSEGEKHLAEMAKAFDEASMTDNGLTSGQQARQFAFGKVRDAVSGEVNEQIESWLSPWGNANVNVLVDDDGNFNGSSGSWFIPWNDNTRYLSWSQLGLTQQTDGLVSNVGAGQRWVAGNWLLGYNTFYDNLLEDNLQRAGLGAEAWGENLRLSANYYQPFAGWQPRSDIREQRMARGYDVTAKAWLPWFHHLNTSVSFEQYFGDNVDLFNSGTG
ncbi:invasin, partial [Enterobacter cloacae]